MVSKEARRVASETLPALSGVGIKYLPYIEATHFSPIKNQVAVAANFLQITLQQYKPVSSFQNVERLSLLYVHTLSRNYKLDIWGIFLLELQTNKLYR